MQYSPTSLVSILQFTSFKSFKNKRQRRIIVLVQKYIIFLKISPEFCYFVSFSVTKSDLLPGQPMEKGFNIQQKSPE